MAEGDFAGGDVPAFDVIGHNGLQLEPIDIERRAVAEFGKLPGKTVSEIDRRDTVAVERGDLPHDLVPLMILDRDGFVAALIIAVG